MTMYTFKFVMDNGWTEEVRAESRGAAVKKFCEDHGVPEDFVRRHCVIKNMGRLKYSRRKESVRDES